MEPTVDNKQNEPISTNSKYTVRMSKLIAVLGIVCMFFFLGLMLLFLILENEDRSSLLIPSLVFLAFGLLGLFITILGLKLVVEVDNESLTL